MTDLFTAEVGAMSIIDAAVEKYEEHFEQEFPLYEFTRLTSEGEYDFSIAGAKRLEKFIDGRIKDNKPVMIPDGYEDRKY